MRCCLDQPRRIVQPESPVTVPLGHMKQDAYRVCPASAGRMLFAIALPAYAQNATATHMQFSVQGSYVAISPCVLTGGTIGGVWPFVVDEANLLMLRPLRWRCCVAGLRGQT